MKMLSNCTFKNFYSTDKDNIPKEFYNYALKNSVSYDRVSGYFTSASLAHYATGIESLLMNNGKFRLIISHEISEFDYNQMRQGYRNRIEDFENELLARVDVSALSNEQKRNFSNLAYLIEIGLVDIKIGFIHDDGLFHAKFGIFKDDFDNIVYFSGSLNETHAAFEKNYENITVLNSWQHNRDELYEKAIEFEELWENKSNNGFVYVKSVDEIVRKKIISFSKGKIIVDSSVFEENALVLYYENGLQLKNNLEKELDHKQRSIKLLIKKGFITDESITEFRDGLTYVDIKEVINLFKKYSDRTGERLLISDTVEQFIKDSEFKISEIAKRGLTIKNKDDMLADEFTTFCKIVNNEVDRRLYDIQSWVSFYQAMMKRVANFSVPGAGKTSMIYGTFAYLSSPQIDRVDKILVISPKNAFVSWKEEFKAVFGDKRKLSVLDIHSEDFREEMFYKNTNDYNLILINYESIEKYLEQLKNLINSRTLLVFDEVHKIKSVESNRAKISLELAKQASYRYVLTGTPIPNTYLDVWNFLHILFDIEFNNYFNFRLKMLNNPDASMISDINEKMAPFFWRVTKHELMVPSENEDNIYSEIATNTEQQLINILWKKYSSDSFKLYMRLIQLSSNPDLLKNKIPIDEIYSEEEEVEVGGVVIPDFSNDVPNYTENELQLINSLSKSSKFNRCIQLAKELMDASKVIVIWCIFVDTILKVEEELKREGYRVAVVYGGISVKEREEIILDFQKGKYDVLISNPHTLAESVSLHMVAHDAIYLEYSFNLTHMLQSRDRIHRLGLLENQETNYYYLMLEGQEGHRNTIDSKIYHRLKEKRDRMYEAIEGTIIAPEFTEDEMDEIKKMMQEEIEQSK